MQTLLSHPAASNDHQALVILQRIQDQLDCYGRLSELAAEQSRHVLAGETDRLLEILQRRQALADRVMEIDRDLTPLKQSWPAAAGGWTKQERQHAEELFAQVRSLIEAIMARDAQDMLTLQERRQVIGHQLHRSRADERTVQQINRRYAASAYTAPAAVMDLRK